MMKQVRVKQSLSYLEAMVGVLGAALGHAQIREADLVEDHRLRRQGKRRRQDIVSIRIQTVAAFPLRAVKHKLTRSRRGEAIATCLVSVCSLAVNDKTRCGPPFRSRHPFWRISAIHLRYPSPFHAG